MQVAKALLYASEKKFRMWQLPARFTFSLPVEIKCAEKKFQLHSQHLYPTLEPLISVYFVPKRTF